MNFFIVDGNSVINRAFYVIKILTNSKGQSVNGVYGFIKIFQRFIKSLKPEYVAIAFDVSRTTFRTEIFKNYKINRKKMPIELVEQVGILQNILSLAGFSVLQFPNFEADDIIGSLSKQFASEKLNCVILSGDCDFFQLINQNVQVYLSTKKAGKSTVEIINERKVKEITGVLPSQIVDLKALMGDASDNIPGCAGIGKKGAAKLINEFGTIENLYNNLEKVKSAATKNNLTINKTDVLLSKKLAEINTNVPISSNLSYYIPKNVDKSDLVSYLLELDMKTIVNNINEFVPHLWHT